MEESKTPNTPENIQHFLMALDAPYKELTVWEEQFLSSVSDQFDRRGTLTDAQFTILERIYVEKTH